MDGSLPGLVAGVIASEETVRRESLGAAPPAVWCPEPRGLDAVRRQASALGLSLIEDRAGAPPSGHRSEGDRINRLLLDAGAGAVSLGVPVVVWPFVPRGDSPDEPAAVERIADAVNRATLVSRLVSLDAPGAGLPEIRFETPFVDLSDAQLADLACDVGARFEDCWWWSDDSAAAGLERARWGPLLPVSG